MPHPRKPFPTNGDPYLKWLFAEIDAQGINYATLTARAGVAKGTLLNIKRYSNIRFQTFRCLLEALGYELSITAKEPKWDSSTSPDPTRIQMQASEKLGTSPSTISPSGWPPPDG